MNLLVAWKKVLLFGLFGAVGCLAGWAVGEAYLAIGRWGADQAGATQGPSLISQPIPPSAEPPPLPTEFRERLDKAGAHSGDIQISLIWYNSNDLDLHCVDPKGYEISWQNRRSAATGGELDVDRNAGCRNPIVEPVENIYWPRDGAPMGHYKVYLDYYQRCPGAPDETRYKINVLHGGERREFTSTIVKDDTRAEKRLIYEFELMPRIEVIVPPEFTLNRRTTIRLPVAVRRSFFSGKLDLKAENLPEGVTMTAASIEAGQNTGTIELKASEAAKAGKKSAIKIVASAPEVSGSADPQLEVTTGISFSLIETILIGVWTALLAVGLCLALLAGQNRYLGRPLLASGRVPVALLIVGALLAGFASGSVGQSLFSVLLLIGVGSLGFVVGWILLGGLLGLGVSSFVPNLDRKKAGLAGLAGGLLGAIGYLIGANAAEWLGRFAGAASLGFCIGLMVALVEAAFRRVWLEVRYGERETITVNLGPEPVKIGGDARACTVWARGAVDVALRYFVRDGKVICEDTPTRKESVVGNGDVRTVGTVTVTVRSGTSTTPVRATPARPSAPPLLPPVPTPPAVPATAPLSLDPEPTPLPRPSPPVPGPSPAVKPPAVVDDDPLPIPTSSAPPARAPVASILDDGHSAPAARPPATGGAPRSPTPPSPAKPPVPPRPAVPGTAAIAPRTPAAPPKPTTPPVPGTGAKPPPAAIPKPPPPPKPAAPVSPAPAGPVAGGPKPGTDADACPTCGRKSPGRPGARFCMMCDKAY